MLIDEIFSKICSDFGESKQQIEKIKSILKNNWFDSKFTLRALKKNDLIRLKIDFPICNQLLSEIKNQSSVESSEYQKTNENQAEEKSENIIYGYKQRAVTQALKIKKNEPKKFEIKDRLQKFWDFENDSEHKLVSLNILVKILGNLIKNPSEQKYRMLKKPNTYMEKHLFCYPELLTVLTFLGFKENREENYEIDELDIQENNFIKAEREIDEFIDSKEYPGLQNYEIENLKNEKRLNEEKIKLEEKEEEINAKITEIKNKIKQVWKKHEGVSLIWREKNLRLKVPGPVQPTNENVLKEDLRIFLAEVQFLKDELQENGLNLSPIASKISILEQYFKIDFVEILFRFPLGVSVHGKFPAFWKLKKVYLTLQNLVEEEFKDFEFRIVPNKERIRLGSKEMGKSLLCNELHPNGTINVLLHRELKDTKTKILKA